jgi:hypothetical protein
MPVAVHLYDTAYICDSTGQLATLSTYSTTDRPSLILVGGVYYSNDGDLHASTALNTAQTTLAYPDLSLPSTDHYSNFFPVTVNGVVYAALLSEIGTLYRYVPNTGWVVMASGLPVVPYAYMSAVASNQIYAYYGTQLADGVTVVLNPWTQPSQYTYVINNGVVSTAVAASYTLLTAPADVGEVAVKTYFWTQLVGCTET